MDLDDNSLKILACDISIRPGNAAGIADVLPYVRSKKVECNTVVIDFEEAGKSVVESFLEAERLCCTGLTWELSNANSRLRLRIAGTIEQITVIEQWFKSQE